MAILTVNIVDRTGTVDPTALLVSAAVGGDSFPNTGAQWVRFTNPTGAGITVTEVIQQTVDGQPVTSRTFSVPLTTGDRVVGFYATSLYNDTNGRMNFTYSAVGLKVGVFQLTTS